MIDARVLLGSLSRLLATLVVLLWPHGGTYADDYRNPAYGYLVPFSADATICPAENFHGAAVYFEPLDCAAPGAVASLKIWNEWIMDPEIVTSDRLAAAICGQKPGADSDLSFGPLAMFECDAVHQNGRMTIVAGALRPGNAPGQTPIGYGISIEATANDLSRTRAAAARLLRSVVLTEDLRP